MAFLDHEGLAHLWNHIIARLNTKVEIEDGKGLSTNDYTDEEKNKLVSIAEGANKTVISTGSANGTISVNTNGTSSDVVVNGLGSAAYTASTEYDTAGAANTALANAKIYTDAEISEWVGDTTVSAQINSAIDGHTHVTTEIGISSGTAALTSGESALPTNTIYVQYE